MAKKTTNSEALKTRTIELPETLGKTLDEVERIMILDAITATGSVRRAAQQLGVAQRTVYYKLREYRKAG